MNNIQPLLEKAAKLFNEEHKTQFTSRDVACALGLRECEAPLMLQHSAFDEARNTSMACSEDLVYSLPGLTDEACEVLFEAVFGE